MLRASSNVFDLGASDHAVLETLRKPNSVPSAIDQMNLDPLDVEFKKVNELKLSLSESVEIENRYLLVNLIPGVLSVRLFPYLLQEGKEFEDMDSYQTRALFRLAGETGVLGFSIERLIQYYALYCIYEATNGRPNAVTQSDLRFVGYTNETFPTWFVTNGWDTPDVDPCGIDSEDGWYGVGCDANGTVTELVLVNNLLTGEFPLEVLLLSGPDGEYHTGAGNLNYLELYKNPFLFNNFETSWISLMGSDLEYLFLGDTSFAGEFPILPEGLIEVDFAYTLIYDGFNETAFANCTLLEYLNMGGQRFQTSVPDSLTMLPNLLFLYLTDCELTGDLSYIARMPSIFELWVDKNPGLNGPLPESLGNAKTSLASLSITECDLTGTIPSTLENLTGMQQLWLYDNKLNGTIPTELGALKSLRILEVAGNNLTGDVPPEVCGATDFLGNLGTLGVDCNEVSCSCCTCCSLSDCQPQLY